MRGMKDAPEDEDGAALPRDLRFLKVLVTVLTVAMIGGVITIRLNAGGAVVVDPGQFTVPAGVNVVGFSVVEGRTVIVGDDGVIRVYDSASREILREIDLP
jgi:uncharacterized membrane protein